MTVLSTHAKQCFDTLVDKHIAYTIAKTTIEAELKNELAERLASFKAERDTALRLADEAGVPRTQLGKAIGTSNYRTIQEILQATENQVSVEESATGKWTLTRLPDGSFGLGIQNVGPGNVTGSATVKIIGEELEFVDGDMFVIPQVYRNGLLEGILQSAN